MEAWTFNIRRMVLRPFETYSEHRATPSLGPFRSFIILQLCLILDSRVYPRICRLFFVFTNQNILTIGAFQPYVARIKDGSKLLILFGNSMKREKRKK